MQGIKNLLPPFSFDSPISKIKLFYFDSPIWVDILGIVWMTLRFLCKVTSLEKRLVHVYDNIENEESMVLLLGHCTKME